MVRRAASTKLSALIVLVLTCSLGCAARRRSECVTVEAVGFAAMTRGTSLKDAHREALLDARRNAVLQAHVAVEATVRVEGMQLAEKRVSARLAGYVEKLEVLEAGVVQGSEPHVYRVRTRAVVCPLPLPVDVPSADDTPLEAEAGD
ncbi:MAG: hypothetical protein ACYTFZ_04095 [Planctomycetota bacterium]|jgi:hypothetical protein